MTERSNQAGWAQDHLAALPFSATLDIDGLGPVSFVHATGRDDNEFILVDSAVEPAMPTL